MNISLDWLKEYIDINESSEELDHLLTMSGLEVEGVDEFESVKGGLKGLVIGEVKTCERHPDADRLTLTTVDVGGEELLPIVCGAPNVAAGQKVVVATVGTELHTAEGESFKIKKGKIRGQVSMGMICAEDEIGMGASHDGILVLDTDKANGTPAAEYFNISNDTVFEIGLTPNRVDAASHYGVARDLKALLDRPTKFPDTSQFAVDNQSLPFEVVVENQEACPRYAGITISDIQVAESPQWLQNKLKAIGLAPINNVVDITNYVLHGLGQPLHAFDADLVAGNKIVVKTVAENTPFVTLDEEERKLSARDLMICDAEKPMCIAGVFGGINSGVTEKTTKIFLESAYFAADWVRATGQRHSLKTDASFRFERGTDPNMPVEALKVAAMMIKELAGGTITSEIVDIYPEAVENFKIEVKFKNIDRLIGKQIDKDRIKQILTSLDIEILEDDDAKMLVSVPPYRVDVKAEADIIEEILRIYGFNNVELSGELSADFLASFPRKDKDVIQRKISEMLAGAGMHEILTNSLTTSEYSRMSDSLNEEENVKILNILSADLDVMRQTLLFNGMEVISHNINRQQKNLRLYEFGKSYRMVDGKYVEKEHLGLFFTGNVHNESWIAKNQKSEFHNLSTLAEKVMDRMNVQAFEQEDLSDDLLAYGISYVKNGNNFAKLGLVNPLIAKKLGIKQEVFYAEFDWAFLMQQFSNEYLFTEIPKFPEVRRDLSLVMSKSLSFDKVKSLALKTERKLLKKVNVFDVYEGVNLGLGKKSYSVSFTLLDTQKTLTDKVIDKTMNRLMQAFEKELDIVIRK